MSGTRSQEGRVAWYTRCAGAVGLLVGIAAGAQGAIPAAERQALIDLYTSTNGAGWTYRTNWRNATDTDFNDPGTECTWYGVTCDTGGTSVQRIELPFNSLRGTLPPSLGVFNRLKEISFQSGSLSGTIPPDLGDLTDLVRLDLSSNQLSGPIPPQLGDLANLMNLCLSYNRLTGSIPTQLGGLSSLVRLDLSANQLTGLIPPELGDLVNLEFLALSRNHLAGPIPPEVGGLFKLEWLWLYENELSGSIPGQLGNLTRLRDVDLSSNSLSSSIPPEIGNLGNIKTLALARNRLSGRIPPELGNLVSLNYLYLNSNQLTGPIPAEIGSLTSLVLLNLESNRLLGHIPPEIGNLASLRQLYLYKNRLCGAIPTTLANLTSLVDGSLGVGWNGLSADDPVLQAFLRTKAGYDWYQTQTTPPTGIATGGATFGSITITWTPIAYTYGSGGYRVWARPIGSEHSRQVGMTVGKYATSLLVSNLDPSTTYRFQVQTISEPSAFNENTVTSDFSPPIDGSTIGHLRPVGIAIDPAPSSAIATASIAATSGILEPGEAVSLASSWLNTDTDPHTVDGAASSFDGPPGATYTLTDATASFGTIASGATANCHDATGNCYAFAVSSPPTRPATHWDAHWLETLSTGEPKTWTLHLGDSFDDVPRSHWAYRFVETILHHEVTAGCDTAAYCPGDTLTRAQMAVLLLTAKYGKTWTPPPATGAAFTDVPADHWAGAFIEELAAEEITSGCGVGLYCPDNPITRAEMAVFLLVAEHGSGWTPPLSTGTVFTDVPIDHWAGDFIEQLAVEGITGGCAPSLYCPDGIVTRAEMAVFLTATFGLELY